MITETKLTKNNSRYTPIAEAFKFITIPMNTLLFLILPYTSKLSRWAQNNPISARIFIAVCHVLAVINAIFLGISLYFLDIGESKLLLTVAAVLFFVCFLSYPLKRQLKFSYVKQKVLDFCFVILCTICIALSLNNSLEADAPRYTSSIGQPTAMFVVNSAHKSQSSAKKNIISTAKEKFQEFKTNLKKQKRSPDKRKAVLVLLVTIFGGILLAMATAIGACAIACSGYAALSIITLVVGAGLITLVFIFGLRRFREHRDNHYYVHGNDDDEMTKESARTKRGKRRRHKLNKFKKKDI